MAVLASMMALMLLLGRSTESHLLACLYILLIMHLHNLGLIIINELGQMA